MPADVDYPALLRLDGRAVLVAGAGQGIGRDTAHALAQCGARVVCLDAEADRAEEVAAEVDGIPLVADIRDRTQVARAVEETVTRAGGLHGLVDIVGMARYAPLLEVTDEDWDWTFDIVLRHAFLLAQHAARAMTDGGTMVFIASVSGLTTAPLHAPYGAAKAGLVSLVRTAAEELGPRGIRVNAVAPGMVWTPRVAAMVGEEGRARNAAVTPLGRIAETSDIAAAVLFLTCDLSRHITGQTLVVDGGASGRFPYPMGS